MEEFGNLDRTMNEYGESLNFEEIFKNHKGFFSNKWIHYLYIYDRLFLEYRAKNKPITILEIGVDRGGSIEIWEKYFPKGSKIHGVDINPQCKEIHFSENITIHLGNASDRSFMEKTFENIEFDIILDDGSHICSDVIETFKIMFPKLKNGGLYVIEDMCASYWANYGGGKRKKGSSIEYFKNLVEALNADYLRPTSFLIRLIRYLFPGLKNKTDCIWKKYIDRKYFNKTDYPQTIESITFYDSICTIKKFSVPKNKPFQSVTTGRESIGKSNNFTNELELIKSVKEMFGN